MTLAPSPSAIPSTATGGHATACFRRSASTLLSICLYLGRRGFIGSAQYLLKPFQQIAPPLASLYYLLPLLLGFQAQACPKPNLRQLYPKPWQWPVAGPPLSAACLV